MGHLLPSRPRSPRLPIKPELSLPSHFLAIDEEGYALNGETRVTQIEAGHQILSELCFAENGALQTKFGEGMALVEAFDEPLIVLQIDRVGSQFKLLFPYGFEDTCEAETLRLDEWDRFHAVTSKGIPCVLSRSAQAAFFDLFDEFDDDSITIDDEVYEIPPLMVANPKMQTPQNWADVYANETKPRWNLGEPAEALKDMLPRLKLRKARVLVPGCGEGHDAAYFASQGHLVTAVDFSDEGLQRGRELYAHLPNLQFLKQDLFQMGPEHEGAYDVIFEHACYAAIDPARRKDLAKLWNRWLAPQGSFMGVFFPMYKPEGPPFGATEWEIRERLKKNFRFLFWGRWKNSLPRRQGKELFVYASKL